MLQQQFFQKLVAAVSLGYENDSYFGTTPETLDTPSNRVDDYVFARSTIDLCVRGLVLSKHLL